MIGSLVKIILSLVVAATLSVATVPETIGPESMETRNGIATNDWTVMIVDSDGSFQADTSLALDSNDYPHMSYQDSQNDTLKYAKWTGDKWSTETVDPTLGGISSLALDSNDYPHIAYGWGKDRTLRYAKWNGIAWNIEIVDSGYYWISLALDSNDYPHIAYSDWGTEALKYAKWNGTAWNIEDVNPGCHVFYALSLALDSNDYPHISYHEAWGVILKYAKWNGTAWNIETADSREGSGYQNSLALDSNDNPHISHSYLVNYTTKVLSYAKRVGASWKNETVDTTFAPLGAGIQFSSIAIDNSDNPHISYSKGPDRHLKYAKRNGASWNLEIVDTDVFPGSRTSIAVDSHGVPHIGYTDQGTHHQKYATKTELEPPPSPRAVSLDIDPDTINLKSKGRWISAYLTCDNGDVNDINPVSLLLYDDISPEWWEVQDSHTMMAKFSRSAVQAVVSVSDSVSIKITGQWMDGESFEAHDTIRVINPGK